MGAGGMTPTGYERFVQGKYCFYSGSSSLYGSSMFSRTKWAWFDGAGNFRYGSSTYSSGDAGTVYGGNDDAGNVGRYRVQGNTILLIFPDGSTDQAQITNRAGNGLVTEITNDGELYSPSLCD